MPTAAAVLRRRSVWLVGAAVVLALVVLLGVRSCQGTVIESGGVQVLVAARQSEGMDAQGGGTLEVVGGCLGANGSVYVFPHGTEVVDDDPLTIELPGGRKVSLGEVFTIGGGFVIEHTSGPVEPGPHEVGGVTVPAGCAEHDVFLSSPF